MNRKQRRAAQKHSHGAPAATTAELFAQAVRAQDHGKLDDAATLLKRLLAREPEHAQARNNLGCVLMAQGKLAEASAQFERALMLRPEVADQFTGIAATMTALNPALREGMTRAAAAWPRRLPAHELLGAAGITGLARDPLLCAVLRLTTAGDVGLERLLVCLRADLLNAASDTAAGAPVDEDTLAFCGVLAAQCFINEYLFAITPDEIARVEQLKVLLADALTSGAPASPLWPIAIAMYTPLHSWPNAQALLARRWPAVVDAILTGQVREPAQELELRRSMARLTDITDAVSARVRQQYEENPYPRWVRTAAAGPPIGIDDDLRDKFPSAAFTPLAKTSIEILVAGCGSGRHPIEVAQKYRGAHVLAIDLSLTSLCYAKRKTPPALAIEYAQADLLELASIGRNFDFIDAGGVLHHLSDPFAGWRVLLGLLRPGGVMHLALYSAIGRRDVVAARAFIAEHGYRPNAEGIRRCREDLLNSPLKTVVRFSDFFNISECRDLLFHVQEHQLAIPDIKAFIREHGLTFVGFEFDPRARLHYRAVFSAAGWSMTDLDRWHALETEHPETFASMYQFWVQKK